MVPGKCLDGDVDWDSVGLPSTSIIEERKEDARKIQRPADVYSIRSLCEEIDLLLVFHGNPSAS